MPDVNAGSMVLFRPGLLPDGGSYGDWIPGYIHSTYWVDADGRCIQPGFDRADLTCWVLVVPAVAEGASAPTTVEVPLGAEHIDPIVHGSEL